MEKIFKNNQKNIKNHSKNDKIDENINNFEKKSINFKKSLGQNFLFDKNLLQAIVADGDVASDDTVLEIGAGAGTLTSALASKAKKVISFEVDESLKPILESVKKEHQNIVQSIVI